MHYNIPSTFPSDIGGGTSLNFGLSVSTESAVPDGFISFEIHSGFSSPTIKGL